ncbi:MAG: hypothetical protein Q9167_002496 [Letrouitia subvulpina]
MTDVSTLCGFAFGNSNQHGYLTREEYVMLHSCERGTPCKAVEASNNIVWITPIVSRSEGGVALQEFRVDGKGQDLVQLHELDPFNVKAANGLIAMCTKEACDLETKVKVTELISKMYGSRDKALPLNDLNLHLKDETITLPRFASLLKDKVYQEAHQQHHFAGYATSCDQIDIREKRPLRQEIQFPYARHSSYPELCHLVSTFKPSDIYPCTFDENWGWERSIENLFGHLCRGTVFCYDEQMQRRRADAESLDTPLEAEAEAEHLDFQSPPGEIEPTDHLEDTSPAIADPSSTIPASHTSPNARPENTLKRRIETRGNLDVTRSFSAWTQDGTAGDTYPTRPKITTKKRTRREDPED